ncbi:MAG: hypothetical protein M1828_003579 [Chrysothrix sp. TS-e1954]|nr:MAG: hypothetical protein M1828_003579 [Chrysothrix sp. TS-e1954]
MVQLGQALYKDGKYPEALLVLEAIEITSDRLGFCLLDCLAAANEKLGKPRDALRHVSVIMKMFSNEAKGFLRAVRILEGMDRHETAIGVCEKGLKQCKNSANFGMLQAEHLRLTIGASPRSDFMTRLPTELVSMVLEYLPFTDIW